MFEDLDSLLIEAAIFNQINEKFDLNSLEKAAKHENGVDNWVNAYKDKLEKLSKTKPEEYKKIEAKIKELKGDTSENNEPDDTSKEVNETSGKKLLKEINSIIELSKKSDCDTKQLFEKYKNWYNEVLKFKTNDEDSDSFKILYDILNKNTKNENFKTDFNKFILS